MLRFVYSDGVATCSDQSEHTNAHETGTGMMDLIGIDVVMVIPRILRLVALLLRLLDDVLTDLLDFFIFKGRLICPNTSFCGV